METSAGIPQTFIRPFVAAKWSAWLVSKESPLLSGSLLSYTQSATYLTAPLPSSPYREHTKNTRVTETFCFQDQTNVQECMHMVKWGVQLVAREPPRAPGYNNININTNNKSKF